MAKTIKTVNSASKMANPKNATSKANLSKVFGIPKTDDSIRNAKGHPTGQNSSGAGWGGEASGSTRVSRK